MEYDPIHQLLHEADRHQRVPPADATRLAEAILDTARRRERRRNVGMAVLTVSVLSGIATLFQRHARIAPMDDRPSIAQIEALDRQIATQQKLVDRLILAEKVDERDSRLAALHFLQTADDVTERAASAVVFQADRLRAENGPPTSALKAYNEVIEHFPQTVSADVARKRVAEFRQEG